MAVFWPVVEWFFVSLLHCFSFVIIEESVEILFDSWSRLMASFVAVSFMVLIDVIPGVSIELRMWLMKTIDLTPSSLCCALTVGRMCSSNCFRVVFVMTIGVVSDGFCWGGRIG